MPETLTPRLILATLLPHLKVAGAYAQQVQAKIAALPAKEQSDNFFAAALTDADLSVQTFVEVALLAMFPQVRFYGEEYQKSYNTKYFRAIDLGPEGDYLITLDPIDGTQYYLDGHSNYQIILSILDADDFAAVIALSPAQGVYYYALRGEGAFSGGLEDNLEGCRPLQVRQPKNSVFLGWQVGQLAEKLKQHYTVIDIKTSYSKEVQIPNLNGVLSGDLTGAVLSKGQFIDGAALAFLAREAGYLVTTLEGSPLPPLHTCTDYRLPGLIVASSMLVQQHLLEAVKASND